MLMSVAGSSEALPCGAVSVHPVAALKFLLVKVEPQCVELIVVVELAASKKPPLRQRGQWLLLQQGMVSRLCPRLKPEPSLR